MSRVMFHFFFLFLFSFPCRTTSGFLGPLAGTVKDWSPSPHGLNVTVRLSNYWVGIFSVRLFLLLFYFLVILCRLRAIVMF